jgi:hypothetical protein
MAQQTAVEYLIEKLFTEYRFAFSGTIVDEAKEMEKEQIMKAIEVGYNQYFNRQYDSTEQYYNETYNK